MIEDPLQEPNKKDETVRFLKSLTDLLGSGRAPGEDIPPAFEMPRTARKFSRKTGFVGLAVILVFALMVASTIFTRVHMPKLPTPEEAKQLDKPPATANPDEFNSFNSGQKGRAQNIEATNRLNDAVKKGNEALAGLTKPKQPAATDQDDTDINPKYKSMVTKAQRDAEAGRYAGGASAGDQRQQRERQALNANPLAVDYSGYFRQQEKNKSEAQKPAATESARAQAVPQTQAAPLPTQAYPPTQQTPTPATGGDSAMGRKAQNFNDLAQASGKRHVIFEDTVIETVLINRINGSFLGPLKCMVTTDVWSFNKQELLIPKGTMFLGTVHPIGGQQEERMFVSFDRGIMPDGFPFTMDGFKGLNVVGEVGLRDIVNRHYTQIFGTSLALAAIGAVASVGNTTNALNYSFSSEFRTESTARMGSQANQVLAQFLNKLPTFTVREGEVVKILFANDLKLPDYKHHLMDPDI